MEDERIIDLFFERSEQAVEELSKKYGKLFMKIAINAVGDPRDAEECVNDAYLGVWNAIPPARPKPLRAFVCAIVRNVSINRWKSNNTEGRRSNYALCLDEFAELFAAGGSVSESLDEKELVRGIGSFLDLLGERDRMLFIRRFYYMDGIDDIAKAAGMPPGTVRTRLTRVRRRLKEHLEGRGLM